MHYVVAKLQLNYYQPLILGIYLSGTRLISFFFFRMFAAVTYNSE